MKALPFMICAALLGSLPASAVSLGEAIDAAEAEAPIPDSATSDRVECTLSEATLCAELRLPDAMLSSKLIKPVQEGRVILFIRGKLVNKGKKEAATSTPQFFSPKYQAHESKMLFFLGRLSQHLGIILSPDEFYEFAAYFILPVRAAKYPLCVW